MLDQLAKRSRSVVPAKARRFLRPVAPIALCAASFAVIGLAWPLSGSPPTDPTSPSPTVRSGTSASDSAIDGFLAMARWGRPAHDPDEERRLREEAAAAARDEAMAKGLNPELAKLGVIGITSAADRHAVLLVKPDGSTLRLGGGDALPDRRILVSVTVNSLVLEDADGGREELLLFPRLGGVTVAGEPPADAEAIP